MVDTGIFATTAQIGYKAGYGKSATASAEAYTNFYIAQAESRINVESEYNWSDAYAALNADVKYILQEAASNLAAAYVVAYDCRGYAGGLKEAQSIIDVLLYNYQACIKILQTKDKAQIFMTSA